MQEKALPERDCAASGRAFFHFVLLLSAVLAD
jgi:hypothetical protein